MATPEGHDGEIGGKRARDETSASGSVKNEVCSRCEQLMTQSVDRQMDPWLDQFQ